MVADALPRSHGGWSPCDPKLPNELSQKLLVALRVSQKSQVRSRPAPLSDGHSIAGDRSGHCRTSTATAGPQWALPDRSGHCRTSSASHRSQWALPDFSGDCQIAVGTAGLQRRLPDRSAHCRTSARTHARKNARLDAG
eukprot:s3153_g1.t1